MTIHPRYQALTKRSLKPDPMLNPTALINPRYKQATRYADIAAANANSPKMRTKVQMMKAQKPPTQTNLPTQKGTTATTSKPL